MIILANVRDQLRDCDEVWYIVRSPGKRSFDETHKHVPVLSPNWQLFKAYRDAAQLGKWNHEWFQEHYVPQFLAQMRRDPEAKKLLNELVEKSREKNIALVCFCADESLCHRSIVGGILYNMGAVCEEHIASYNTYCL